jgi:hypothetical protein
MKIIGHSPDSGLPARKADSGQPLRPLKNKLYTDEIRNIYENGV